MPENNEGLAPAYSRYRALLNVSAALVEQPTDTDGLVEVFNRFDDMLGVEGLKDLVQESTTLTLTEMQRAILDGVAAWSHGPLADDVSLVIVQLL